MDIDLDEVVVRNNEALHRYEAHVNGRLARIDYQRTGDRIIFTHTEVPEELEGHGLAARMAHVALEEARALQLAVIPRCPFVASYIRRHPAYLDLLPPDYRERFLAR